MRVSKLNQVCAKKVLDQELPKRQFCILRWEEIIKKRFFSCAAKVVFTPTPSLLLYIQKTILQVLRFIIQCGFLGLIISRQACRNPGIIKHKIPARL